MKTRFEIFEDWYNGEGHECGYWVIDDSDHTGSHTQVEGRHEAEYVYENLEWMFEGINEKFEKYLESRVFENREFIGVSRGGAFNYELRVYPTLGLVEGVLRVENTTVNVSQYRCETDEELEEREGNLRETMIKQFCK